MTFFSSQCSGAWAWGHTEPTAAGPTTQDDKRRQRNTQAKTWYMNHIIVNKRPPWLFLLSLNSLQTQTRVHLSCRRSRRSWQRSWGQWRNETCWSLCWRSRGWRRGLRTGTWRALFCPRATSSTGPRPMTATARRTTARLYLISLCC